MWCTTSDKTCSWGASCGTQQRDSKRPVAVQLEALPTLDVQLRLQPVITFAGGTADRELADRCDHLVRDAVDFEVGGAQDFVPRDDVADGGDHCLDVPRSGEPRCERNVVDRAGSFDPVGEPGAQLRRRQRRAVRRGRSRSAWAAIAPPGRDCTGRPAQQAGPPLPARRCPGCQVRHRIRIGLRRRAWWPPASGRPGRRTSRRYPPGRGRAASRTARRFAVRSRCRGSRYSVAAAICGSGRAARSILPCVVIGISSSTT